MPDQAEFREETQSDLLGSSDAEGPFQIVRVGTWFWRIPDCEQESEYWVSALAEALEADTRVDRVEVGTQTDYWNSIGVMYPDESRTTARGIQIGSDGFHVLRMSRHVKFRVRVPIKNQTSPHGNHDDIPSDTYYVAWDGISVFVLWENVEAYPPLAGGHVVADVLRDVTASIESDLYIQACSPQCDFMFTHSPLRLVHDEDADYYALAPDKHGPAVAMGLKYLEDPFENVGWVAMLLGGEIERFASFKNVGRRLIDLENQCRSDLGHVLSHVHRHAELVADGRSVAAIKQRWKSRRWRHEARSLVAAVWLAIANIEILRRRWDGERGDLMSMTEALPLLERDLSRDVDSVQSIKLEPVTETINQLAITLDNRNLARATALGALVGGIAGGLTGLLR